MKEIIFPKNEVLWMRYYASEDEPPHFIITSKRETREWYFLYEYKDGEGFVKLGKARTPPELEEKYKIQEKLKGEAKTCH